MKPGELVSLLADLGRDGGDNPAKRGADRDRLGGERVDCGAVHRRILPALVLALALAVVAWFRAGDVVARQRATAPK